MPPINPDTRGPARSLFRHFKNRARGSSVLKYANGTYVTVIGPSQIDMEAAVLVYLGGHIYEVSDDEAAALQAAGYTVDLSGAYPQGYFGGY